MTKTTTFYGLWACYFIGCLAGLMAIGIAKPVILYLVEEALETGVQQVIILFRKTIWKTSVRFLTPR
jgi:hypothetical protein